MEQINMMSQWQKCRNDAAYPVENPDGTVRNYVNTRKATEIFAERFPDEEIALVYRHNDRVKTGFNHWMVPAFCVDAEMSTRNFEEPIWCKIGSYQAMLREQNRIMRRAGCSPSQHDE
ncbi:MAG: hypothetical protein GY751_20760 [Bacteroidetes bacterium]|jgi:hypothetical protein|nr:hypothetical protein [Bacteroidota bacterium]|tara:strand:+ start:847 stop:1200 length:354 start_codon:yes stop_codon:yes gene_type:complete